MFGQRNRTFQQQIPYYPYYQHQYPYQQTPQSPVKKGLFQRNRRLQSYPEQMRQHYYQQSVQPSYYPQQYSPQQLQGAQAPKQSFFRDEQGKIDFQKIGGGVQSAIGLMNQVGPMMKMFGGLFK